MKTINNNNKNKGMYLETIIENNQGYSEYIIFKKYLPIVIKEKINTNMICGKLLNKSTTDYYGIYNGLYFDFEAKQTINEEFYLNSIKKHQLEHLEMIHNNNGISFVTIHFFKQNIFFAIDIKTILKLHIKKTKKISINYFKENCFELKLKFPGFLDFKPYLDYYISNILTKKYK